MNGKNESVQAQPPRLEGCTDLLSFLDDTLQQTISLLPHSRRLTLDIPIDSEGRVSEKDTAIRLVVTLY